MARVSNRFLFQLHGWFSLPVWVLFSFVCLTGTVAVMSHEFAWLTNENIRAVNPDNRPAQSVAESVATVKKTFPDADVTGVSVRESYMAHEVMFTATDKPFAIAYVNPYSGDIQEVNDGVTFIGFMRTLHGWLYFPWHGSYSLGYYLVSLMSVVMLGALITGLLVFKKFWQAYRNPKIRSHQGPRTLTADLHKLAGAWSIWFMVIMSATGLWYLIQSVMWHADIEVDPWPAQLDAQSLPVSSQNTPTMPVSLAQAITKAESTFDNFQTSYIMMPEHNRDTYKLYGGGNNPFYDGASFQLAVNPWNGEITQTITPQNMDALQTIMHIADPLHFGTIGGIWTKLLWFVFGLILSGMSVSGFIMWYLRLAKARTASRKATAARLQEA